VVSIDIQKPSLMTSAGKTYKGDLIIGSDGKYARTLRRTLALMTIGLHSMAREIVIGQPAPPVSIGQMQYQVTLPSKVLQGVPELEEFITVPRNNYWLGPYGTVLSYLLQGLNDTLIHLVFTLVSRCTNCLVLGADGISIDSEGWMPEGINQRPGRLETIRKRFEEWDPRHVL
jgi:salicylate hydroxylase